MPADTDAPEPVELYDDLVQSLQIGVQGSAAVTPDVPCFTASDILPFDFTPDSQSILVRGMAGVQIINLDTLKEERFLQAPQNIIAVALAPDGETLAWSLEDNTIQLLQVSDQEVLHTLSGHTGVVTKLRFSPDGDLLVSASHDYSVRVWNLQGEALRSFQPPGEVLGIGISPDGSMLATVPYDGPVALWDLDTLKKIKDLGGSGGYDTSDAEFSPDGRCVAADLATGLYLWSISDGELVWNEIKNSMTVAFSPDARYLAYADIDDHSNVFLSTVDGSQIVHVLAGHQGPVWGMFFSPDSHLLVSADGLDIRIWRVEYGSLAYIGKAACP
jgi:WD40 repeat protein